MATEILVKDGTPIVWADTTDFSGTLNGYTRTHQILLAALASAAARQGAKADLGATRAARYAVHVGIEFDVAPASGTTVDFYWAASHHGTAGTNNPGGTSGADGAYTGTAGDSIADSVKALIYLGSLILTADAATVVQYGTLPEFVAPLRYGMPVVVNNGGQALEGDDIEMFFALIPLIDESQ